MLSLWIASSLTSRNIDSAPLAIVPMFIHYWVGFRASQEIWVDFGMKAREQGNAETVLGMFWSATPREGRYLQPFSAICSSILRASELPFFDAAVSRTVAWAQFFGTPSPRRNRSPSVTSAGT